MGLFDSVLGHCSCGGIVEFQSKAGECLLKVFPMTEVPVDIAGHIEGDRSVCDLCHQVYEITYMPQTRVEMKMLKVEKLWRET
jgi:hypothetical protein